MVGEGEGEGPADPLASGGGECWNQEFPFECPAEMPLDTQVEMSEKQSERHVYIGIGNWAWTEGLGGELWASVASLGVLAFYCCSNK